MSRIKNVVFILKFTVSLVLLRPFGKITYLSSNINIYTSCSFLLITIIADMFNTWAPTDVERFEQ